MKTSVHRATVDQPRARLPTSLLGLLAENQCPLYSILYLTRITTKPSPDSGRDNVFLAHDTRSTVYVCLLSVVLLHDRSRYVCRTCPFKTHPSGRIPAVCIINYHPHPPTSIISTLAQQKPKSQIYTRLTSTSLTPSSSSRVPQPLLGRYAACEKKGGVISRSDCISRTTRVYLCI